jgi:Calcineurin-like phosphoesterase
MTPLVRFAVLSDTHLAPAGTQDGMWNNVTCLSASHELLRAAVADIASAGISQVVLLGDVSDRGDQDMIAAALAAITGAGLRAWAVPGNHDVSVSPDALPQAVRRSPGCTLISQDHLEAGPGIAVRGHRLRSDDSGQTCEAIDVPDPAGMRARLLLWASHYPVLSQRGRFRAAGLRYPGDLRNLSHVARCIARFDGPVLVLYGHLHATAVKHAGPLLQVGVPAVIEWPHAWTEAALHLTASGTLTLHTTLRPIPGTWPAPQIGTTLAGAIQNWTYTAGRWDRNPGS